MSAFDYTFDAMAFDVAVTGGVLATVDAVVTTLVVSDAPVTVVATADAVLVVA